MWDLAIDRSLDHVPSDVRVRADAVLPPIDILEPVHTIDVTQVPNLSDLAADLLYAIAEGYAPHCVTTINTTPLSELYLVACTLLQCKPDKLRRSHSDQSRMGDMLRADFRDRAHAAAAKALSDMRRGEKARRGTVRKSSRRLSWPGTPVQTPW